MSWLESLDEHVRRLTDFTGRESRWDYWGWVVSMGFLMGSLVSVIVAWRAFSAIDQAFEAGGFARIRNIFIDARLWAVGAFIVAIAAATARRLHDVGRSAVPAILPAALTVASFWAFGRLFKGLPDPLEGSTVLTNPLEALSDGSVLQLRRPPRVWDASLGELAVCGLLTVLALATAAPILIALIRNGDPNPNDYGPVPAGIDP